MKLAPVGRLAVNYVNEMGYAFMWEDELEQLHQAIISDFVSVVKSECDKLSESSKIAKDNIYHSGIEDVLSVMAIVAST